MTNKRSQRRIEPDNIIWPEAVIALSAALAISIYEGARRKR